MIHHDTYNLLKSHLGDAKTILLLGDQFMNLENTQQRAIDFLEENHGMDATDMDINGAGVIAEDLAKPIRKGAYGPFDIVADFGTSEHVTNLHNCLKNVLNFTTVGGTIIHANPLVGHFPEHTREDGKPCWKFTSQFWEEYAKAAKLELVETREQAAYHNPDTGMEVYAVLKKTKDSKPITLKKFAELSEKYLG